MFLTNTRRRQYESTRDDSHDGSFLDHFTGLLER